MTVKPKADTVVFGHPKLVKHLAQIIMRIARTDLDFSVAVGESLIPEQQRLVADYIRKHRKRTKERFL